MRRRVLLSAIVLLATSFVLWGAFAADTVPTDVQVPGTQPGEVGNIQSPDKCDNCHGGYDLAVEPAWNWRGSMMAQAGRDPIFWATVAIAEQDFDGSGDLCIRCHSGRGWLGGRSTPTDGSGLQENDTDGVTCDVCHGLTNPDDSEHLGEQHPPFVANDGGNPPEGYYGSGAYVMWDGSDKLGPYPDAEARHQWMQSDYHRDAKHCGTCHDVSNPVTGDVAPNQGAQVPLPLGSYSGTLGGPVTGKAAFNNPPYAYGVVERTFSEHVSSALDDWLVTDYASLPADLQDGAIQWAYEQAQVSGTGGNHADGTPRVFSCQTCHMAPSIGAGCDKKGAPTRTDLPWHDLTGGNYWMPQAILWMNDMGTLRLGGSMSETEKNALAAGVTRALANLTRAASLETQGNAVKVVNLTGHKLLSGYPEGRRMWLDIKWYDAANTLLREDGEYGDLTVTIDGQPAVVRTLLDLNDPNTRVYEAHGAITEGWAATLISAGTPPTMPIGFDRVTGAVTATLADVAVPGSGYTETFHFVLNNHVAKDNRIPPYGFDYDEARVRNALPVPDSQFGAPGPGGQYDYWDLVPLNPPAGATWASIDLLYQPTSWEYIQFLLLANDGSVPFLADEGVNLKNAWLATGMAEPEVMASTTWGSPPATCTPNETPEATCDDGVDNDCDEAVDCDDTNCSGDPACAPPSPCNANTVCEPGEDCLNCPSDCAGKTSGKRNKRYCCGNGVLEAAEGDGSMCDQNP